jgi:putative endonuclease
MAAVYILYSQSLNKYYIGSCIEVTERLDQHLSKIFPGAFTMKANDWIICFSLINLSYDQARKIESHIKNMKSKKYIENLKRYPELSEKLIDLYSGKH